MGEWYCSSYSHHTALISYKAMKVNSSWTNFGNLVVQTWYYKYLEKKPKANINVGTFSINLLDEVVPITDISIIKKVCA